MSKEYFVISVLGGPGAGKGTQCSRLVNEFGSKYNVKHLSAGELLRKARDTNSFYRERISLALALGGIVPMHITIELLVNKMDQDPEAIYIIDGFPRKMDQAKEFEEMVVRFKSIIFYDCPEEELSKRLIQRGLNSNRGDDNPESIELRFQTFREITMPVVEHYEKEGLVKKLNSHDTVENVYQKTRAAFLDTLLDYNKISGKFSPSTDMRDTSKAINDTPKTL